MDGKLRGEVLKGKEMVGFIETPMVLTVAAFNLTVRTDEFMADAQTLCGSLKQGGQVPLGVGETVVELKTVVSLDTLHGDAPSLEPFDSSGQEVRGGVVDCSS